LCVGRNISMRYLVDFVHVNAFLTEKLCSMVGQMVLERTDKIQARGSRNIFKAQFKPMIGRSEENH
jgi:hypothetical protein